MTADLRLDGKVAVVTGGGRGIGRGIALSFAKEGARVAIASRTLAKAEEVASEISDGGGEALAIGCDVADNAQVDKMVARVVREFGAPQILVNNAQAFGSDRRSPTTTSIEELSEENFMATLRSGLFGTWYCSRAVAPYMKKQSYGKIINFGSNNGVFGAPGRVAYSATKEAIRGFSKTAAREWGPFGIRVNVICPAIESDSWKHSAETNRAVRPKPVGAEIPLGYVGQPERDAGGLATFLASPDSDYLTGNTIFLEGGWHYLP